MADRQMLLKEINETSFAVMDATLYLDTHPTDEKALAYFEEVSNRRKAAMKEFEENYEPLTMHCVNTKTNNATNYETEYPNSNHWTWADGKAPWEGDN